jgi:hypothetical protein
MMLYWRMAKSVLLNKIKNKYNVPLLLLNNGGGMCNQLI